MVRSTKEKRFLPHARVAIQQPCICSPTWLSYAKPTSAGGEDMEPLAEIAKQLQELRREIAELKKQQGEILAELQSGKRLQHVAGGETVQKEREQPATLEMYCSQCLELRPVARAKRVVLPDGSAAIQGRCAVCGTTAFRMTSMSGVLIGEAASTRVGRQQD